MNKRNHRYGAADTTGGGATVFIGKCLQLFRVFRVIPINPREKFCSHIPADLFISLSQENFLADCGPNFIRKEPVTSSVIKS